VLKEFLKEHGSEVHNMLLSEFSVEDAVKLARREGREEGREEGLERGLEKGLERGLEEGQQYVIELLERGYNIEDIKRQITRTTTGKGQ
jgi:flagellar biosynthesis/type III secretory pathway protein FliH